MHFRQSIISDSCPGNGIFPIGTEIFRIQQTIENLKKGGKILLKRINTAKKRAGPTLIDEICQDILRIYKDWDELRSKVEPFSDVFLDKHFWLAEISEGLKRSSQNYIMAKKKLHNQRYPPLPAIECGLNMGL